MPTKAQQTILDMVENKEYRSAESSGEIYLKCPFCGRENKFYISPKGQWLCFRCDTRGNSVLSFTQQYYKVPSKQAQSILKDYSFNQLTQASTDQTDPKETLFDKLVRVTDQPEEKPINKVCPSLPSNIHWFKSINSTSANPYLWYLKKRGLSFSEILTYHLGYVIEGQLKRFDKAPLEVKHSIVIPTFNQVGQMVYWNTRSIEYQPFVKSINAIANDQQYSKRDVVWNQNWVNNDSYMVICEGVFNAMTCTCRPYIGVATFGKMVSNTQVELMRELKPARYYLFLDNDAKDQEYGLAKRLINAGVPRDKIYIVNNPYGNQDANDLGRPKVLNLLNEAQLVSLLTLFKLRVG